MENFKLSFDRTKIHITKALHVIVNTSGAIIYFAHIFLRFLILYKYNLADNLNSQRDGQGLFRQNYFVKTRRESLRVEREHGILIGLTQARPYALQASPALA